MLLGLLAVAAVLALLVTCWLFALWSMWRRRWARALAFAAGPAALYVLAVAFAEPKFQPALAWCAPFIVTSVGVPAARSWRAHARTITIVLAVAIAATLLRAIQLTWP
ncbi:MAG TPA: hypothetical protein VFQ53_03180 [Kofleriaceae bacterium]|nr:hypothetical protein [Kofleriaceae bacterium]